MIVNQGNTINVIPVIWLTLTWRSICKCGQSITIMELFGQLIQFRQMSCISYIMLIYLSLNISQCINKLYLLQPNSSNYFENFYLILLWIQFFLLSDIFFTLDKHKCIQHPIIIIKIKYKYPTNTNINQNQVFIILLLQSQQFPKSTLQNQSKIINVLRKIIEKIIIILNKMKLCLCANCGNYHCDNYIPVPETSYMPHNYTTPIPKYHPSSYPTNIKNSVYQTNTFTPTKSNQQLIQNVLTANRLSFDQFSKYQSDTLNNSLATSLAPTLPKLSFQLDSYQRHSSKDRFTKYTSTVVQKRPFSVFQNKSGEIPKQLYQHIDHNHFVPYPSEMSMTHGPRYNSFVPINKLNQSLPLLQFTPQQFSHNNKTYQPIRQSSQKTVARNDKAQKNNQQSFYKLQNHLYSSQTTNVKPYEATPNLTKPYMTTKTQQKDSFFFDETNQQFSNTKPKNIATEEMKYLTKTSIQDQVQCGKKTRKLRVQSCTYKDNRCFGIDFGIDKFSEIDKKGHKKDYLYK